MLVSWLDLDSLAAFVVAAVGCHFGYLGAGWKQFSWLPAWLAGWRVGWGLVAFCSLLGFACSYSASLAGWLKLLRANQLISLDGCFFAKSNKD